MRLQLPKATPAFEEDPQGALAALDESYANLAESYDKLGARCDQTLDSLAEMRHQLDVYSQRNAAPEVTH